MELFEFKFYKSYTDTFKRLPDETAGKLIKKMYQYYFFWEDIETDDILVEALFPQIKYTMEKSIKGKQTWWIRKDTSKGTSKDTSKESSTKDKEQEQEQNTVNNNYIVDVEKIYNYWQLLKQKDILWKTNRKLDNKIQTILIKIIKTYSKEDIEIWIKNYLKEIQTRRKDNEYSKHRFTLQEFFTNSKWFSKFYNLSN